MDQASDKRHSDFEERSFIAEVSIMTGSDVVREFVKVFRGSIIPDPFLSDLERKLFVSNALPSAVNPRSEDRNIKPNWSRRKK